MDGGRASTYASLRPTLRALSEAGETLELLVLSHIDNDHVGGLLELMADSEPPIQVEGIWFNPTGVPNDLEVLGFDEASAFEGAVRRAGWPLNDGFADGIVAVDGEDPIARRLGGGLRLTVLSPDRGALARLRGSGQAWFRERRRGRPSIDAGTDLETLGRRTLHGPPDVAALLARPETVDRDPANGASIALLAEWRGRRVLLGADAHPGVLARSLRKLGIDGGPVRMDLVKVSHHGAKGNTSTDLLDVVECSAFAFSTDGSRHGHPDPETVARIVSIEGPTSKRLLFNYRSHNAEIWDDPSLRAAFHYDCTFPTEPGTLTVQLDDQPPDDQRPDVGEHA